MEVKDFIKRWQGKKSGSEMNEICVSMLAVKCECDEDICKGWAMIDKMFLDEYKEAYAFKFNDDKLIIKRVK
jgi:hypothetical protein